ncbi:hypothetical protein DV735_g5513, partial [Chaetothyriales sp. CBS 134920]
MRPLRALFWLTGLASLALADNDTQPISVFRSRPDLIAPILTTIRRVPEKQAPGYYFIAPYQQLQESVHIYDNDANLVYSGFGNIGPGICHAPQTCMYHGEVHLCFYQGTQMLGWGHGHGVIVDKHYRVVKSVEPGSYQASSDMHEFKVIDNGKSALMTQYLRSPYNMCPWGLCDGLGYIQQGAFQEVDVDSGAVKFEWRSLDHVDPSESYVAPSSTEISGSGEQPRSPWDYFHINSIDKNKHGDYLVSARHTSTIYKISGKDGHVIWRLNGAKSDYQLDNFHFAFQHDARWISDENDYSVISVFDNGSNGFNTTKPHSNGFIIRLNHKTKVATVDLKLDPPFVDGHAHLSKSQGNMQRLANGNIVMGWGNDAFWTEYAGEEDDYEIVFYGVIGWRNVMNYRVHKFDNWVGLPLTKPALWTYSKSGLPHTKMSMYVSWNGATEVKQWRFYTAEAKTGPWKKVATVAKNGFETLHEHDQTSSWTYAQALDKRGYVLGSSEPQLTFTPVEELRAYCDDVACNFMPTPEERERAKAEAEANAKVGDFVDPTSPAEEDSKPEAEESQSEAESSNSATQDSEDADAELTDKTYRKAIIYGSSFGGLTVLVAIILVLSTKNNVSRPVHAAAVRAWDAVGRTHHPLMKSGYNLVKVENHDDDQLPN